VNALIAVYSLPVVLLVVFAILGWILDPPDTRP
jgi:hypothetical protein